ncbi:MAG: hypothetical protein AAGJ52_04205 [Pseudomonadota bacterium]
MNRIQKDALAMAVAGLVFLIVAVVGFTPLYFTPLLAGDYTPPSPWMHSHALSSLAWLLIFLIQPLLIVAKRRPAHRLFGRIGLLVAVVTLITGVALQLDFLPLGQGDDVNLGAATARFIGGMGVFLPAVALAVFYRRKTAWHLRLMFLSTLALMAAPFARVMIFYLAVDPAVAGPMTGVITLAIAIGLVVYDRLAYGKVARASWVVLAVVFTTQMSVGILLSMSWWTNWMTG